MEHINICKEAVKQHTGDIVEIGAGLGEATKHFLEIAAHYNRRVLVIDPFEAGWNDMPESYGKPYPLDAFHANVKNHKDRLTIHQKSSLCLTSELKCHETNIAFAYIDGLQYHGAVLNDLRIVKHAHVICVDDMNRVTGESQVPSAVKDFCTIENKTLTIKDRWAIIT